VTENSTAMSPSRHAQLNGLVFTKKIKKMSQFRLMCGIRADCLWLQSTKACMTDNFAETCSSHTAISITDKPTQTTYARFEHRSCPVGQDMPWTGMVFPPFKSHPSDSWQNVIELFHWTIRENRTLELHRFTIFVNDMLFKIIDSMVVTVNSWAFQGSVLVFIAAWFIIYSIWWIINVFADQTCLFLSDPVVIGWRREGVLLTLVCILTRIIKTLFFSGPTRSSHGIVSAGC
jgi:hypothetical protein